jgi:hypothetical protein
MPACLTYERGEYSRRGGDTLNRSALQQRLGISNYEVIPKSPRGRLNHSSTAWLLTDLALDATVIIWIRKMANTLYQIRGLSTSKEGGMHLVNYDLSAEFGCVSSQYCQHAWHDYEPFDLHKHYGPASFGLGP